MNKTAVKHCYVDITLFASLSCYTQELTKLLIAFEPGTREIFLEFQCVSLTNKPIKCETTKSQAVFFVLAEVIILCAVTSFLFIFSDMAPNATGNHTINHEAILVSDISWIN